MAIERLKFRCYNCNQLLSVPETRTGSVVACPKCQADLLIPGREPAASATAAERAAGDNDHLGLGRRTTEPSSPREGPLLGDFTEIASILPVELANLRPEDVRVEAEFFGSQARPREPEPSGDPELDFSTMAGQNPAPAVEPAPTAAPEVPPETPVTPAPAPLSSIEMEPQSILSKDARTKTIREVVLPASVVLAWSLFGLVGLFVSFLAGLMVGHFMWKHP